MPITLTSTPTSASNRKKPDGSSFSSFFQGFHSQGGFFSKPVTQKSQSSNDPQNEYALGDNLIAGIQRKTPKLTSGQKKYLIDLAKKFGIQDSPCATYPHQAAYVEAVCQGRSFFMAAKLLCLEYLSAQAFVEGAAQDIVKKYFDPKKQGLLPANTTADIPDKCVKIAVNQVIAEIGGAGE